MWRLPQMSQLFRLVSRCRLFSWGLRSQTQVNENVQAIPDNGIEILRDTDVLAVGCVRRFGKARSLQQCSRALGAAIVLTHTGWRFTVLILNHERPVSTDYSFHQLRVILAEHTRRSRRHDATVFLPLSVCRRKIEDKSGFARNAVDHWGAIHGSRVGLTRGRIDVAVNASQDQIAGGLQPPVRCPDSSLGVETYQRVIR